MSLKSYFILAVIFLSISLISCRPQNLESPETLRLVMSAEPATLNPITATDAYASQIDNLVNDTLIDRDHDTLEFIPKLAKSWEVSSDHLRYTFYLRDDVFWHDGKPFTADDVVYSFERIQDPKVDAPHLRVYFSGAGINKIKKIDQYTVQFISDKPYFKAFSICGSLPLIPKHIYNTKTPIEENTANRHPIGLGPYKFSKWKTGKKIELLRNESYWDKKPDILKVDFYLITDSTIALQVLKKEKLDQASLRPIQWIKQTNSEKFEDSFYKLKYLLPGYNYIAWNLNTSFFSDPRVRLAMTSLVNREKLLEKLKFSLGEIVTGPFFVDSPQYNKKLKYHPYDPEKAKNLLKEAGWVDSDGDGLLDKNGKTFSFTFLYPASSKFSERLSTILKEDLKKIGIEMDIQRLEWAAFLGRIREKDFEATSLGWSTSFEGDPYQIWHSSQADIPGGSNFISYKNKEVDQIIEEARVEFNEEKRNELYHRFHEILYNEQPYTFLFANYSLVVVSKRFDNVKVHKTGLDFLEWSLKKDSP